MLSSSEKAFYKLSSNAKDGLTKSFTLKVFWEKWAPRFDHYRHVRHNWRTGMLSKPILDLKECGRGVFRCSLLPKKLFTNPHRMRKPPEAKFYAESVLGEVGTPV